MSHSLPNYDFCRSLHLIKSKSLPETESSDLLKSLVTQANSDKRLGLLMILEQECGYILTDQDKSQLQEYEKSELTKLDDIITEAKNSEGDVEVKNALLKKAEFLINQGYKDESVAALKEALLKTVGSGSRIDNYLLQSRLGFFFNDNQMAEEGINLTGKELETGGDWERKNKFLIYKALLFLKRRQFKESAELLMKCIQTFTAVEILSLKEYTLYTVVTTMLEMDRTTVQSKVLSSSEILSVTPEINSLQDCMENFYFGNYSGFFQSLVILSEELKKDRYLSPHVNWIMKKFRVIGYKQFLYAYKSVQIERMASAFGVPVEFIEQEISEFTVNGDLNVKIDKITGVIETVKFDMKGKKYMEILRQGDAVINKLQMLSKIVDL
jgi:26S proteasome regulatory subunit N7